jgi:hypothetical protein
VTETRTLIPSARRLMTSLRGLPYDVPGAVADLVDNSLDADATEVDIELATDWRGPYIRIADNGVGMTERELDEAMRYGSAREYTEADLGHFGLGLKTASLSQCRRLTVATRTTIRGRIRVRRWDLDRVREQDEWVLERPRLDACRPQLSEPLRRRPGAVVLWEELDRILGARRPDGEAALRRLSSVAEEIARHLSMVFHRFLDGDTPGAKVVIRVNGEKIPAWDPFARSEQMTQELSPQSLRLDFGGRRFRVRVRPFVLPGQQHFSSPDAHAVAAGPKRWNRQQGLYIYRRDRLIQSGGWNRLRTMDEHSKLARIALDIPPAADPAFRTDVAKMHVTLPESLRPHLRVLVTGVVAHAQETYRQRVRLVPSETGGRVSENSAPHPMPLGDHWPMIVRVLERELADHPELLDRVLLALVNADPAEFACGASGRVEIEAIGVAM